MKCQGQENQGKTEDWSRLKRDWDTTNALHDSRLALAINNNQGRWRKWNGAWGLDGSHVSTNFLILIVVIVKENVLVMKNTHWSIGSRKHQTDSLLASDMGKKVPLLCFQHFYNVWTLFLLRKKSLWPLCRDQIVGRARVDSEKPVRKLCLKFIWEIISWAVGWSWWTGRRVRGFRVSFRGCGGPQHVVIDWIWNVREERNPEQLLNFWLEQLGGALYWDGEGWGKGSLEKLEIKSYVFALLSLSSPLDITMNHDRR